MIDPRTAADEAARQIVAMCVFRSGMDPDTARNLAPMFASIVLTAITRADPTPNQGINDR